MKLKDEETYYTFTTRSYSCLQVKNISEITTTVKVQSNVNPEQEESTKSEPSEANANCKMNRRSPQRSPKRRDQGRNVDADRNFQNFDIVKQEHSACSTPRRRAHLLDRARNTDDGIPGDFLFSCPFELVEIYSNIKQGDNHTNFSVHSNAKRENNGRRTFEEENAAFSIYESYGERIFLSPKTLKNLQKETWVVCNDNERSMKENKAVYERSFYHHSSNVLQNDRNGEPTRDQQNLKNFKHQSELRERGRGTLRNNRSNLNETSALVTDEIVCNGNSNKIYDKNDHANMKTREKNVDITKKSNEDSQGCSTKNIDPLYKVKNKLEEPRLKRLQKKNDELCAIKYMNSSNSNSPNDNIISEKKCSGNNDTSVVKEEDLSSSSKESTVDSNFLNSDSQTMKSFESNQTSEYEESSSKSSSNLTNTVINTNENDACYEKKRLDTLKNNDLKVVIENKKKNTKDPNDVESIANNGTEVTRIDNVRRDEVKNGKDETAEQITKEECSDHEDVQICMILKKIHEQLSTNGQKIENLRQKLKCTVPTANFVDLTILLQLLEKTIARCKNYIHGSNDSYEAELEVTELLSNYIVQLTNAVKKSKRIIEEQEAQWYTQSKSFQQQSGNNQKKNLNDITLTWSRWTNEIACLMETISSLLKNFVADCEKTKNKSPQKCKAIHGRTTNNISTNNSKQKNKVPQTKSARPNPLKEDSSIETQMNIALNASNSVKQCKSKASLNPAQNLRNREKENLVVVSQNGVIDKKINDSNRYMERRKSKKPILGASVNQSGQFVSRQKHRVWNSSQPVWRPGGRAKVLTSSSTTTLLTQEARPSLRTKEKVNPSLEYAKTSTSSRGYSSDQIVTKRNCLNIEKIMGDSGRKVTKVCNYPAEEKQGRLQNESMKNTTELCSAKDSEISLRTTDTKISNKRSNTNVKAGLRLKPRPGTIGTASKSFEESLHCASESNYITREKLNQLSKDTKLLNILKEICKSSAMDKMKARDTKTNADRHDYRNQKDLVPDEQSVEAISLKEKIKMNEEEPTRDIDSNEHLENRCTIKDTLLENPSTVQNLLEKYSTPPISLKDITSILESNAKEVTGAKINENSPTNPSSNFVSATMMKCTVDSVSSPDHAGKAECHKTSLNTVSSFNSSNLEQIDESIKERDISNETLAIRPTESEESRTSTIKSEKSKTPMKSHTGSLNMLKEFLYSQGVDFDLVNRAEKCMMEKQKVNRGSKKKSVNFAESPSIQIFQEDGCKGDTTIRNREESSILRKGGQKEPLEMKDVATCTEKNYRDACSQTDSKEISFKSSQTVCVHTNTSSVKLHAIETQTEVTPVREVARDCFERSRNTSTMTESFTFTDRCTDTVKVAYVSKAVSTEVVINNFARKPKENVEKNCSTRLAEDIEKEQERKKYSDAISQLLNQIQECDDVFSKNYEENYEINELHFAEANALVSSSSSDFSSDSDNFDANETVAKKSSELLASVISSKMIAAFEIAAIRARNVFRSIDIYERHIKGKLKRLEARRERENKAKRDIEMGNEKSNKFKSSSTASIVTKNSDKYDENGIICMSRTLREMEMFSMDNDYNCIHLESDYESTKSSLMTLASDLSSENGLNSRNFEGLGKTKSIVLKDVRSLMEFLLNETERTKFKEVYCIHKSDSCSTCYNGVEAARMLTNFAILSRENLLPLIYGIVCSIVFWCLQFTITCDITS